jgi:hypothetical protein
LVRSNKSRTKREATNKRNRGRDISMVLANIADWPNEKIMDAMADLTAAVFAG